MSTPKNDTRARMREYLQNHPGASALDLMLAFGISRQSVHHHLGHIRHVARGWPPRYYLPEAAPEGVHA